MKYYATHLDLNCPTLNGPIPDCGSIIKLIEYTTCIEVSGHFGKPSEEYVKYIQNIIPSGNTLVVGDRATTDYVTGQLLGAQTFLVETGDIIKDEYKTTKY